jgi:hypothetical protein
MAARVPLALALLGWIGSLASACPFCSSQGQTLSGEVGQADFIVLGTLSNVKRDPEDPTRGTTDLTIQTVVKPHPYLNGKTMIVLPRSINVDTSGKKDNRFLVFCGINNPSSDVAKSAIVSTLAYANFDSATLDPYRGEEIKGVSKLGEYLKGAIEARDKDAQARLRFFFEYLDAGELIINQDAYMEFGNTDYKDVRKVAPTLPASKLLQWLKDPGTPASRHGLYGLLLGHSGKPTDAKALRELLDAPDNAYSSGLDGMIAGYILLDPKAGWEYLNGIVNSPKKEFSVRYAALKVLRFLWDYHPEVVSKPQLLEAMKAMVLQDDISDLPMEDLRKWGQWELTDFVLGIAKLPGHSGKQIVKRAILRFALSAAEQKHAGAIAYVEQARKDDPERVKFAEEMLADEKPKPRN